MKHSRLRSTVLAGIGLLAAAPATSAQAIVNGSMDGVADFAAFNGVTPPGWTGTFSGTDLWDATTTAGLTAWLPSYGGGPFVHGAGVQTGVEWITQSVSGLTIGTTYVILFEQSISDSALMSDAGGYWQVEFGPDTLDSDVMVVPPVGVPLGWQPQALNFTASSTTQLLRFTAYNENPLLPWPPWRVECGLDSVKIEEACATTVAGTEIVRLGTPPNPFALLPSVTGPPSIGAVWDPKVEHVMFIPGSILDVYILNLFPTTGPVIPAGTVLCSSPIIYLVRTPTDSLGLPIPYDCGLGGARFCLQAVSVDPSLNFWLTNALDIQIGN